MEKIEKIKEDLKNELSEKRYLHSIGTMKMSKKLAKIYGIDEKKAEITGLLHDIGKELSKEEKLNYVKKNKIAMDEVEEENIGLLHGKIGADIAKKRYGISEEMVNAIKYHTTAYPKMDTLAKIIFVSDKIEENRKYNQVEELRELAKKDLDKCILIILDYDIKENIDKNKLIHPNSIYARNRLLTKGI